LEQAKLLHQLPGSEIKRLDLRCREASAPNRPYRRAPLASRGDVDTISQA